LYVFGVLWFHIIDSILVNGIPSDSSGCFSPVLM
jgi:hypothetical protein